MKTPDSTSSSSKYEGCSSRTTTPCTPEAHGSYKLDKPIQDTDLYVHDVFKAKLILNEANVDETGDMIRTPLQEQKCLISANSSASSSKSQPSFSPLPLTPSPASVTGKGLQGSAKVIRNGIAGKRHMNLNIT